MNNINISKKLFSIITINFNNAEGLKKTIESLKKQKFQNYEHIIIDGGSSDKSVEIIQSYLKDIDYSKKVTYWCSEKDNGIYNAMNKGISHAKGEYVYFLNSGDCLIKNSLELVSEYAINNDDKILYGAVDSYLNEKYLQTIGHSSDELNRIMIPHQGVFVPLSFHKKYGLYNENFKICADREFMFKLKNQNEKFLHIPIIVCNYDYDGISSKRSKLKDEENFRISNQFLSSKQLLLSKIRHIIRLIFELLLPGFITIPIVSLIRKIKPTAIVE